MKKNTIEHVTAKAMESFSPEPMSGCWVWTGYVNPLGYGTMYGLGRIVLAHRVVCEHLVGPIPPDLQIDHKCRLRCCVNPDHLEPVTIKQNVLRGVGLTATNAKKTHCPQGHEYTAANTYTSKRGMRACRTCAVTRTRLWRSKTRPVSLGIEDLEAKS